jgi:hypothetical protein
MSKPRKKPVQREAAFQMQVARYLDMALPPECWWTTFPAGGGGKARGGKLKAMGLKPGVADILILTPRKSQHATRILWLELKSKGGRLGPAQKAFMDRMYDRALMMPGVNVRVVRTLEQVEAELRAEFIQLRAYVSSSGLIRKVAA